MYVGSICFVFKWACNLQNIRALHFSNAPCTLLYRVLDEMALWSNRAGHVLHCT